MEAYQRLASAAPYGQEALEEQQAHLEETYGKPPEEAKHFFFVMRLKSLAQRAGISGIDTQTAQARASRSQQIVVTFDRPPHPRKLYGFVAKNPGWEAKDERTLQIALTDLGQQWSDQAVALEAAIRHWTDENKA